ncbi:MAG TPA: hypothetical protein VFO36_10255, partial [Nitrospiraceae bacterium]|nr:hypothetical protein [Nitrospiraceae bacterium]
AMALDRFDSRVDWTAEEATALRTTYFRAEMLNEPHRSQLQATLREYARARLVPDDASRDELIRIQTRNEQLRARLFRDAQAAVSSAQEPWMTSGFIHTMETALQIGARRALAARIPMPSQIIDMLLLYLIVSIGVLGYLLGLEGTHRRYASNFVIALFVLAILLIIDIDRPRSGPIKVSNLALEDLIRELDAAAAHREPVVGQVPPAGSAVRAENER